MGCKQTAYTHILHPISQKKDCKSYSGTALHIFFLCTALQISIMRTSGHRCLLPNFKTSTTSHACFVHCLALACTHNPEGTYTDKLAMARGPKYDDRSHSHCKCKSQDSLSERVWMYVDSEYHEVQRMERHSESRRPRTEKIHHDRTNHMDVHLGCSTVCDAGV